MSNPPRWPYPGPGSSSRPSSPYIPSHVQSPPGRLTSPLPFMSATPPPMLIRPTATGPHHVPRHESPRPFAPPRWSPAHAKSPPPPPPPHLQFSSPRPFFRPIAPVSTAECCQKYFQFIDNSRPNLYAIFHSNFIS